MGSSLYEGHTLEVKIEYSVVDTIFKSTLVQLQEIISRAELHTEEGKWTSTD